MGYSNIWVHEEMDIINEIKEKVKDDKERTDVTKYILNYIDEAREISEKYNSNSNSYCDCDCDC